MAIFCVGCFIGNLDEMSYKIPLFDDKHLTACDRVILTKLNCLIEQKIHILLSFCLIILVEELLKCSYF